MELQLDFSSHLPQRYLPSFDRIVSLLTQTVPDFPRGGAMLTRQGKGTFVIKVYDKTKAEKLMGKKIEYYYEGDKSQKKVSIPIQERKKKDQYVNPKYITMTGFDRFPAEQISNEQIDRALSNFGKILVPTQDVYGGDIFLTGKKKVRLDLDKGEDIPREFFIEFSTNGKKFNTSIRVFYKDQPYFCKKCMVKHIGDCPEWRKMKEEEAKVK